MRKRERERRGGGGGEQQEIKGSGGQLKTLFLADTESDKTTFPPQPGSECTHLQHNEAVTSTVILGTDAIVRKAESNPIFQGEHLSSLLVEVPTLLEPLGRNTAEGSTDETSEKTILFHCTSGAVNDQIKGY